MITCKQAAGFIAGGLQGNIHIHPAWNSLDPEIVIALTSRWATAIEKDPEGVPDLVFGDLESNPVLGPAWAQCHTPMRESIRTVIRAIVANTR